jgi:hypothetical protein
MSSFEAARRRAYDKCQIDRLADEDRALQEYITTLARIDAADPEEAQRRADEEANGPVATVENQDFDAYLAWASSADSTHPVWRRVAKKGVPGVCWPWVGSKAGGAGAGAGTGGVVMLKGKTRRVHHIAWELEHKQPVPEGFNILHTCDNSLCCNPAHLFARRKSYEGVEDAENMKELDEIMLRAQATGNITSAFKEYATEMAPVYEQRKAKKREQKAREYQNRKARKSTTQ